METIGYVLRNCAEPCVLAKNKNNVCGKIAQTERIFMPILDKDNNELPKKSWKFKVVKWLVILCAIVAVSFFSLYKINNWFDEHTFKFSPPVQFHFPVRVERRNMSSLQVRYSFMPKGEAVSVAEASAELQGGTSQSDDRLGFSENMATDNKFIERTTAENDRLPGSGKSGINQSIQRVVDRVYRLESSATNSEHCAKKQLFNGYGFAPGTCYKSQDEVERLVTAWFEKNLPIYGLAGAVCGYNLGFDSPHLGACRASDGNYPYYKNFLNLN